MLETFSPGKLENRQLDKRAIHWHTEIPPFPLQGEAQHQPKLDETAANSHLAVEPCRKQKQNSDFLCCQHLGFALWFPSVLSKQENDLLFMSFFFKWNTWSTSFWGAKIILAELSKSSRGCWGCWCRTDWETHLQMLSFKAKNWKLKKKKEQNHEKKTPQPSQKTAKRKATLQLLYSVGCFWWNPFWLKQHNPFSFPGVSQVWWGTALGSVGTYLFFCILYCVWIQKIDRRNTFRSPGEPESIFSQTLPCSQ